MKQLSAGQSVRALEDRDGHPAIISCILYVCSYSSVCWCCIFIIFTSPGQSSYARHPQGRDTKPVTEVLLNTMVDTMIRETAIDCELELEKKTGCGGRADQVLRAVVRGKGEYED